MRALLRRWTTGNSEFTELTQGRLMLTAQLVRVRFARDRVIPRYLDPADEGLLAIAADLIAAFRSAAGRARGDLAAEFDDLPGDPDAQFVHRGLIKLLEDRCEFGVVSGKPPEEIRAAAFGRAAQARQDSAFDRATVLAGAAGDLGVTELDLESGLFADLKNEQRLMHFDDVSPERLLRRYNVALAQGILLKAARVTIDLRREPPARLRAILRRIKFHRLVCAATSSGPESCRLVLEGPLSLFSATHKYGLQLASFLTAVIPCRDFELKADLLWGAQRKPKTFALASAGGLVAEAPDGARLPPELEIFAEIFRKKISDWRLVDETTVLPLGDFYWAPDFRLEHRASGRIVYLDVLGHWRRSEAASHWERLRRHAPAPVLVAVSDRLRIDDDSTADMPAEIIRFRDMPLPADIAERLNKVLSST
jgi:uncharacterized protein